MCCRQPPASPAAISEPVVLRSHPPPRGRPSEGSADERSASARTARESHPRQPHHGRSPELGGIEPPRGRISILHTNAPTVPGVGTVPGNVNRPGTPHPTITTPSRPDRSKPPSTSNTPLQVPLRGTCGTWTQRGRCAQNTAEAAGARAVGTTTSRLDQRRHPGPRGRSRESIRKPKRERRPTPMVPIDCPSCVPLGCPRAGQHPAHPMHSVLLTPSIASRPDRYRRRGRRFDRPRQLDEAALSGRGPRCSYRF